MPAARLPVLDGLRRSRARAFLLDMDGVVADNMPAHVEAWRRFFLKRGIVLDAREFRERTMGMPTREVLAYYFRRKVPRQEALDLCRDKERLYRRLYRPALRCARGLRSFLSSARRQGWRLGLGTGALEDNVSFLLGGLGLRRRFDAVVTAAQVRRGKPHPETFLALAAELGVAPRRCVVFEDSLLGEEAAHRAGMSVAAITTSHGAGEFRWACLAAADFSRLTPEAVWRARGGARAAAA
ncbi:MAG: HAD-IA family hydrolase [Elusimicrobia bacterium]|nr:HAD-IA family hydrolase [Elusimicrobiota bacterium]MDE2424967.1 HAD-IA family hydrolase [Elusimicrobiota bacterium]